MSDDAKALALEAITLRAGLDGAVGPGAAATRMKLADLAPELARAYLDLCEPAIDWTKERKDRLRTFLESFYAVLVHCDQETKHNGRCECMEYLAQAWTAWEQERDSLREQLDTARAEVERLTRDEHSAVERGNRLARKVERLRGALALWRHVAYCDDCQGPHDGCDEGQRLEGVCINQLDCDPYKLADEARAALGGEG